MVNNDIVRKRFREFRDESGISNKFFVSRTNKLYEEDIVLQSFNNWLIGSFDYGSQILRSINDSITKLEETT